MLLFSDAHIQKNCKNSLDKKNLTKMCIKHYFLPAYMYKVINYLIQSLITAKKGKHDFAKELYC